MPSTEEKLLTLRSKDNKTFIVKESIAVQSSTIKNMVEDGRASIAIPLCDVDSGTLAIMLEYLNKHGDSQVSVEDKKEYDSNEIAKKPIKDLLDILAVAYYLDIKGLIEVVTQAIADNIKDISVEEFRTTFGIVNDFTPEEEADMRKECP